MEINDRRKKIIELIQGFQENHDVQKITAANIQIWPVVLFELKQSFANKIFSKKQKSLLKFAISELCVIYYYLLSKIKDRISNTPARLQADYIFLTQSTRRVLFNGKYFDRICDPFVDALKKCGYQSKVWEWSYDHRLKTPRYNPSSFIQFQLEVEVLKNMFQKRDIQYELEALNTDDFKQLLDYSGSEYERFIKQLKNTTKLIIILAEYFEKKIKKENAKAAFFYPYYGTVSFAYNLACKRNKISTVEIQHGYYGERTHMQNGIRKLESKNEILPDYIWCWEERDKIAVEKWGRVNDALPGVYVGGNLW